MRSVLVTVLMVALTAGLPDRLVAQESQDVASPRSVQPWDYDPYRVLVWLVADDPALRAETLCDDVRAFLKRDFDALWRVDFADAPASVRTAAGRTFEKLDFDTLAASDPVVAVKRNHPEAIRLRFASDLPKYLQTIHVNQSRLDDVRRRGRAVGDETLAGLVDKFSVVDGDARALVDRWRQSDTEAVLLTRGMAATLTDPEAKMISPPISDLVIEAIRDYDKIQIVRIETASGQGKVSAVEFDTLMRYFGTPATVSFLRRDDLPVAIGECLTEAFAPVVRLDEAGTKTTSGLVRGGGLIVDEDSPARIRVGDVLRPMIRKNDRNGRPIQIGPVDWATLLVQQADARKVKAEIHAGKRGGLKVRMNNRTFRTALKIRRPHEATLLRLHAKGDEDQPLVGYEIHERQLDSKHMDFVGRTDWNGRLTIEKNDQPMRLFYVQNGGAVLAKLPMVPGGSRSESAGLIGDDLRLQAEAYVRGVQNAIVDLVAIRELFAARIRLRLKQGEVDKARDLLQQLQKQPTNQTIADALSNKQDEFVKAIGRNANQRRKVDELFATTRETLVKFINGRMISELEIEVVNAGEGESPDNSAE